MWYDTSLYASTEIINLEAILSLPKGTEHFMSDIHGEFEAFYHIMNNCSDIDSLIIENTFLQIYDLYRYDSS